MYLTSCYSIGSKSPHYCWSLANNSEFIDRMQAWAVPGMTCKMPLPMDDPSLPIIIASLLPQSPHPELHLSQFSHFCRTSAVCPSHRPLNNCMHTHTFDGPFSGTIQVSRYQKGKTNLDFTEARDSEWQWHQLGHMQVCTSLQTDNHASGQHPTTQFFAGQLPFLSPNLQCQWYAVGQILYYAQLCSLIIETSVNCVHRVTVTVLMSWGRLLIEPLVRSWTRPKLRRKSLTSWRRRLSTSRDS